MSACQILEGDGCLGNLCMACTRRLERLAASRDELKAECEQLAERLTIAEAAAHPVFSRRMLEDKLAAATVNQLATAMGIVIDKYTANEAIKSSDAKETNFFEAIRAAGKEVDLSAIPELQSSAERDPLLVDETGAPE